MSKKKNANWENINKQMNELKNPLSFIYNIINLQNKIDDYNLSLVIRFFIKNHIDLTMKYPLFVMINMLNDEFIITKKVVNDYYSSILKKYLFLETIMKFKNSFKKNKFWEKNFNQQRITLENILQIFRAHFDATITGLNGVTKFASLLKFKNNPYIFDEIKNRLFLTTQLLGYDFFKSNNIKVILAEDFEKLSTNEQVKFIVYYFLKVEKSLKLIINVYDLLAIYDNKIKQIINPKPIFINFNRIYSETDSEDIQLLVNC